MRLQPQAIHIWTADLTLSHEQEIMRLAMLSADEMERANRLRTPLHRQHFIAARSALRQIAGFYLNSAPQAIEFAYAENGKPYLPTVPSLQFNLAHSHDKAVYAFALDQALGIDIEKMRDTYNPDIVQRYFSPQEKAQFAQVAEQEKTQAFYRVWARKEAVIKASGKGLSQSLSTFSVSVKDEMETLVLENETWSLMPLHIHPQYQSALVSQQKVNCLYFWHFFAHGSLLDKIYNLSS